MHESSVISGYRYDGPTNSLILHLVDGSKWAYLDVPQSVYEEFKKSDSLGAFWNYKIKGKFRELQVENTVPYIMLPEVIELVDEALKSLRSKQIERAAWRLADALGGIKKYIDGLEGSYSVQGITEATGQGFQVVDVMESVKEALEEG